MTELEQLKSEYIAKFGGYPSFLLRGASEDYVVGQLKKAIQSGKEIEAPDDSDY